MPGRKFEAIIFDFGGVITQSPFEGIERLERERGLPPGLVRRVNATNPDSNAWARLERSEITLEEFDGLFAEEAAALGGAVRGSEVMAVLSGAVRPEMVAALDRLGGLGYRLGCITNNMRTPGYPDEGMRADPRLGHVFRRFDHVVESALTGLRKPDPRIYALACDMLAVEAGACVYLDDLGINCKPAAAMGMHAIKVTGGDQALAALEATLGHALS
ncbi:MAG: HAD-IA family hydrolase [Novosphingobium sp.]